MSERKKCDEPNCGHDMPISLQHCPHCGRPRRFPNVDVARIPREVDALQHRYDAARAGASRRGADANLQRFEAAVERARPVIAYPLSEVRRLARSDSELAITFYSKGVTNLAKGSHVLQGAPWDTVRPAAESALFGDENKREIHFAALSPDDLGVTNYGECSVTLRTELVAHRTTAFHENMLVFFKTKCDDYWRTERLPAGYLSAWPERTKLAVAKLAGKIDAGTPEGDFARILLTRGATSADDEFIELHVFGMMTVRTFEKVVLTQRKNTSRAVLRATEADVKKWGGTWLDQTTTR